MAEWLITPEEKPQPAGDPGKGPLCLGDRRLSLTPVRNGSREVTGTTRTGGLTDGACSRSCHRIITEGECAVTGFEILHSAVDLMPCSRVKHHCLRFARATGLPEIRHVNVVLAWMQSGGEGMYGDRQQHIFYLWTATATSTIVVPTVTAKRDQDAAVCKGGAWFFPVLQVLAPKQHYCSNRTKSTKQCPC